MIQPPRRSTNKMNPAGQYSLSQINTLPRGGFHGEK